MMRVFDELWRAYGVQKIRGQLRRAGFDIARCRVAWLMKVMGVQGTIRGKPHRSTVSNRKAPCPFDKVNRSNACRRRTCSESATLPMSRPGRGLPMSPSS
ncbi:MULTISPECIES: IS3 family transposase [unclassified Paracoccus (in: a-proteobacteria)]|uniref:IS3 family transposase n=1 Tax=unclassified Paracoccus (in: a-proteobacteria) TaxID=2688777 RepID=UPI0012B3CD46